MSSILHIIEPTLTGTAGHCYSFVSSLCSVSAKLKIFLWCGKKAQISLPDNVVFRPFFFRRIRIFQSFWLYRKLLKTDGRLFISTAGRTDLFLLALAACGKIPPNKVFIYVHWFRTSPGKLRQLTMLAKRQPEIAVLSPSNSVHDVFKRAGFASARIIPYPITPCESRWSDGQKAVFSHLLFAGAARKDKGFSSVVDLVEFMQNCKSVIPVSMQTSAEHYNKYDKETVNDILRLKACGYKFLKMYPETLTNNEYIELFKGAISLQIYSQQDFADRISGVTLDSFSAGSPIITISGTWMAKIAEEFKAGIVLETTHPTEIYRAVLSLSDDYIYYRENALKAGLELQKRHNPGHLLQVLIS